MEKRLAFALVTVVCVLAMGQCHIHDRLSYDCKDVRENLEQYCKDETNWGEMKGCGELIID